MYSAIVGAVSNLLTSVHGYERKVFLRFQFKKRNYVCKIC
jgi:hypothetical protein